MSFLAVTFFRNWPCRVQFTFGLEFFFLWPIWTEKMY
jgi:hypothetical protein